MSSGEIFALKLRRENAINAWRTLMGPTNSEAAKKDAPNSIRALYGTDIQANACHGSDAVKSAQRELEFHFPSQYTLGLIKPDSVKAGNERAILYRIESEGFRIVESKKIQLTKEKAEQFYDEHKVLFCFCFCCLCFFRYAFGEWKKLILAQNKMFTKMCV